MLAKIVANSVQLDDVIPIYELKFSVLTTIQVFVDSFRTTDALEP